MTTFEIYPLYSYDHFSKSSRLLLTILCKHLRPISLTPILSKVAEEIVLNKFIKPAILKMVDPFNLVLCQNLLPPTPLSVWSITLPAPPMATDLWPDFFSSDYCKAFDLIDHYLLVNKLCSLDIPPWVVRWVSDFLTARQQRVKLGTNDYSEWSEVPTGVPQGRILGPWLYALMINDLDVSGVSLWKYVVALTVSEIVPKNMTTHTVHCGRHPISIWVLEIYSERK